VDLRPHRPGGEHRALHAVESGNLSPFIAADNERVLFYSKARMTAKAWCWPR